MSTKRIYLQGKSGPYFTKAEARIITLLTLGYSQAEIAEKLHRSKKTIATELSRFKMRLGIEDTALIRIAAISENFIVAPTSYHVVVRVLQAIRAESSSEPTPTQPSSI